MGNYSFRLDLEKAKVTEKEVADILIKHLGFTGNTEFSSGNVKGWDIMLTGDEVNTLYEVKEDFYCAKSDNIAIEVECRGKPSGLMATTSDYWCIKAHLRGGGVRYLKIPTSWLKEQVYMYETGHINGSVFHDKKTGGDTNSNTVMYLANIDTLMENKEVVDIQAPTGESNTVFVFGSNMNGEHIGGSAKHAFEYYGAEWSVAYGPTGSTYAIPTLDNNFNKLPLNVIQAFVDNFLDYVKINPELTFEVVDIGCGIAGFEPEQIAPMFIDYPYDDCLPPNLVLSDRFNTVIKDFIADFEANWRNEDNNE